MYILIIDDIPSGIAINAAAHGSLACFLKFASCRSMQEWLASSFKKVTCKVTPEELGKAMVQCPDHVVITESSLGHRVVGAAFCPRASWHEMFSTFKLYK